ncbi:class I SAM-dependent methyltransferase [Tissierella sp.]|uniref:class I SAM-dependent methyltransferase n=1 Tax=Tissierella sp. TaxID=41274 RepID=UPI0028664AFF|nr:class I SAM-dependent methyltransferase [Tissierella sp.]MDR7856592.1 class I SAM-dependent methyltransferase [Tissierella sp.]
MAENILIQNKKSWDAMADSWFGTTALPTYGCLIPTEDELKLFPDIQGKKVLDIGCGSGHSLKWCGDKGASELWGLDMSTKQIENARNFLNGNGYTAKLINSPMESDCGIPNEYFDVVYSIYAIGWTVDLQTTFNNIATYLKKDGIFIFSWDHPLMRCVDIQDEKIILQGSYLNEHIFSYIQRGNPVTLRNRNMSAYINTLAKAGFMIEQLVEETNKETLTRSVDFSSEYYSPYKAQKLPLSFIIKARKI